MIDWIVKLYRRLNSTVRRAAVLVLALIIAMSTMHVLTFPATAISRQAGEEDPGIVLGGETNTAESFDNASEGEGTEVNPVSNEETPAEEITTPEGETPAPEEPTVPDVTVTEPTDEPVITETEPTEVPSETIEPETTETPQPTEAATDEEVIEENEEPEEESDPEADVETAKDWEDMFRDIELTGVWADDLITLAETQIGYKESTKNFIKDEGKKYGYTRYGEWYGDPYAEWDSLFVMFNLSYAGITPVDFPYQADCEDWIDELKEKELFHEVNTYIPVKGDLVFADADDDGETDHVAIVKGVIYNSDGRPEDLVVIEGNADNAVKENKYEFFNPLITGFAKLPENPAMVKEEAEAEAEPRILSFTGSANRVDVTVLYEEGTFPEGTTMQVKAVWDRPVIDAINETVASDENVEVVRVQAVDITFYDAEGNEIEPSKPIQVTMKSNAVPQTATDKPVVVHVDNEMGTSVMNTETPVEAEDHKEAVTFEAGSFSVYAMVYTLETYYTSFDGETFKITLGYTSEAELPEGAELDVREILPESEEYSNYLNDSAAGLGVTDDHISFARFFDINIVKDGEIIEPASAVSVNIVLNDTEDNEDSEWKVVHFANETPDILAAELKEAAEEGTTELEFAAESFSVYGVITVPAPASVNDLNGYSVKISNLGYYVGAENITVGDSHRLSKTNSEADAPLWTFEATGTAGRYYIYTVTEEGNKQYINIKRSTDERGDVSLSDERQALTVVTSEGKYRICGTDQGHTYFLNQFDNTAGIGFAGWWYNGSAEAQLDFTFVPSISQNNKEYMVVVKQGDSYYVVLNDGTLEPAQYNEEDNTVAVDDPMMWKYDGERLYHVTREAGFTGDDIPSDSYYRYIDPNSSTGLSEDDETNTTVTGDVEHHRDVHITSRTLWDATRFIYTDHKLQSASNSNYYIGVDGQGRLKGQVSAAEAVQVFLADPVVKEQNWMRHSVGHIDISINGTAEADVPLAYGKYYDENGNVVKEVGQNQFEKLHLTKDQVVDQAALSITPEDMKRSRITAVCNGETLDNAFYITGYSGNAEHGGHSGDETDYVTSPQVRIEGSFLVAKMPEDHAEIEPSRYDSDQTYRTMIRQEHLANQVQYNVTVAKSVEFYLQIPVTGSDGETTYQQLYDADGNALKINVDLAFSDSFSYWDEDNECPVFVDTDKWYYYKNYDGPHEPSWVVDDRASGDVARCGFSGMDFKLGGAGSASDTRVYAIEITKIVVDERGNRIKSDNIGTTKFNIYRKAVETITSARDSSGREYLDVIPASADEVKDLNIGSFVSDEAYATGYSFLRDKSIQVGNDGFGLVYDYNVTPGLYYIEEDPDSVAESITDTTGKQWDYKKTYIWTEYAWRNHNNDNFIHVGQTYTGKPAEGGYKGVPEILGNHYGYNGTDGPYTNDFLEFFVYNVYESPKVDVPVVKNWPDYEDDDAYNWEAEFTLQWAPLYPNEDTPSVAFQDVTPVQTMKITKADMAGNMMELVTRYLAHDSSLTPEEIAKVEKITFKDLPKYGTDANGNTFRYQYSLEETSYKVINATTGVILYSWSDEEGYNDPENGHYVPYYPHDAGETGKGKTREENEADTNYYVLVENKLKSVKHNEYIDVSLEKQWDDESFGARSNDWYAEFELRRFVHTEYRDLSHMSDADMTAEPVTVTIKDSSGETIGTLQTQPNMGLYVGGNFKPHDTAKSAVFTAEPAVRFANDSHHSSITVTALGENMSNALVRSTEFFVTQDTVITLSNGEENLVEGNLAKVLDTAAGTNPLPDRSYSQTIRLDNENSWTAELSDLLRAETSEGEGDNENVTLYEYYLVEKDSNPKGYAQYFRADEEGHPTTILSGDSDHQIEHDDSIIALNGPSNRLIVKKLWRGAPITTGFPGIKFTLWQADDQNGNVKRVFTDENGTEYKNIELKGNNLEWICPVTLPATFTTSDGVSHNYYYYVQEDERSGSASAGEGDDRITVGWEYYYYLSTHLDEHGQEVEQQTNSYNQGNQVALIGSDVNRSGGTITICNKFTQYTDLDIKKQYFTLLPAGSWENSTSNITKDVVLGFKVIRAIKTSDGKYLDERGNVSDKPVWMDYSDEMLCGYDSNGNPVLDNGGNEYYLKYMGLWHFEIMNNWGDQTNIHAGDSGSSLPTYGFYIQNGEDVVVEYEYSFRETNVYKNLNRDPYPEWDWFSSVTPVNGYGPGKTAFEAFPKVFHGQDPERIANFQASDLIIDKQWIGEPDAKAVYIKIWRTSGNKEPEDFTAIIAEDVRHNNNWQMYLSDPSEIDLNRDCLVLSKNSEGRWTSSIKVNRALLGSLMETGEYHYYIQEVGYRTMGGEYKTNVNATYKPLYDRWDASADDYTDDPVGMNDYAANNITIGMKGENRLKVINRVTPSTSYTVTKAFNGPQSSSGGSSSVTGKYPTDGSKQVVVELQQRYRFEKNVDGADYVSADGETWFLASSPEAATTWCNYESEEGWQSAESASPKSIVLPLDRPEGSTLSDEAWYGSAAAWTYTWEGLDVTKVISEDADPENTKRAQLYYRAVEVSTPGWFNSVIAEEDKDGHKAIPDNEQSAADILIESNTVTNERNVSDLVLNKEWTGLGAGKTWPDGVTIDYQLVQYFQLALADMSHVEDGQIVPSYSTGKIFKSVDMVTPTSGGTEVPSEDSKHPQAIGINVGKPKDGSTVIANITGLPMYGFLTATEADVEEAKEHGVTLTAGKVYPVVYTYAVKETAVKKNGQPISFKPQTVNAVLDETVEQAVTYKATLTNELVSVSVGKEWNGLKPGTEESATIQLYRFEKDPEVLPETEFQYTVRVSGTEEALSSEGTVTAIIYDDRNNEVGRYVLRKNEWSYTFALEIGKTYHAQFVSDGTVLDTVAPAVADNITEEGSVELTATVKPAATGRVKVVVTGSPTQLWLSPLKDSNQAELSPQKQFSPNYFNGNGGETSELDGLLPGTQYTFNVNAWPDSVDGAVSSYGLITFTAVDGLRTITLNYGSGGGGEEEEDNVTITASASSWISWPSDGHEYYKQYSTNIPPRSGSITVQIDSNWNHAAGEIVLSADNNWTASATFNQKNLAGYSNGERIGGASFKSSESPITGANVSYNNGIVSVIGKYPESERSETQSLAKAFKLKTIAKAPLRAPIVTDWINNKNGLPTGADPEKDTPIDTVIFSGDKWSNTWTELPKYSDEGKEYVYYAYETQYTGVAGATTLETTYSMDPDGNWTVTNTPTYPNLGNLKVNKEVFYGNLADTEATGTFKVGIFSDQAGTARVQEYKDLNVLEGRGEVTFSELPAGTYFVYEIDKDGNPITTSGTKAEIDGVSYTVTYTPGGGTVVNNGETAETTVRNTKQPFDLNLIKIEKKEDGESTEIPLSGAEFELHKLKVNPSTKEISYDTEMKSVITKDDGTASFEEIAPGYYEIKESKAPKGYVLTGQSTFYIKVTSSEVNLVIKEDGKEPDEWETGTEIGLVTFNAETITATIENEPGHELPKTGGQGTGIFGTLGGILILAGAYLLTKRKKQ